VVFDPGDLALRMGMSANVRVPLFRKDDVVLVPTMAVQRDADGLFVIVVQGRQTQQRRVQLGISDGINTEVISGLQPGEVVRIVMQQPIGPVYY
jgi:macrolide-specific efflux system membrane fusion protein